jgi:hypothetical protein
MFLEKHRPKKIFKNFENNFGQNDKKLLPLQPQTKG